VVTSNVEDPDPHGSGSFWEAGSGSVIRIKVESWIRLRIKVRRWKGNFGELRDQIWENVSGRIRIRIDLKGIVGHESRSASDSE
jgi:hypothetical protein